MTPVGQLIATIVHEVPGTVEACIADRALGQPFDAVRHCTPSDRERLVHRLGRQSVEPVWFPEPSPTLLP